VCGTEPGLIADLRTPEKGVGKHTKKCVVESVRAREEGEGGGRRGGEKASGQAKK